jgi:hypothetical protein
MPALTIRDEIGSEELRRRARRERDGRVSRRLMQPVVEQLARRQL